MTYEILRRNELYHFATKRVCTPYALGGSTKYEGKDLRSAHQHLVDRFDATVENLVTAMRDLNVPGDLTEEAGNILESTRNEVLCR